MKDLTRCIDVSRISAALFCGMLALSFAAVCPAADQDGDKKNVKYEDLDVAKSAGAAALYFRLTVAASDVCRSFNDRELESQILYHRCVQRAIADAVEKIDQPALYAVYNFKNPSSKAVKLAAKQAE